MTTFNTLVTSSSNKTQLIEWIKKSVKKINKKNKVYCGDCRANVTTKFFCDYFWHMPKTTKKNFRQILNFCIKNKIKIIIPTSDNELILWSKFKKILEKNNIHVMVSEKETIINCIDKLKFYQTINSKKHTLQYSRNIKDFNGNIKLIARPANSSGTANNFVGNYSSLLKNNLNKTNYFFQKFLNNCDEITVDCYFSYSTNQLIQSIARQRKIISNGESAYTTTINNSIYNKFINQASEKFKFSGHINFQFLKKKEKIYWMECNPRIGGASCISYFCNMDSINYFINETFYKKKINFKKNKIFNGEMIIFKSTKFLKK